jgi:hypothetical protein
VPKSKSLWSIRPGAKRDRGLLSSFTCADPSAPWEVEVEAFVQGHLLGWALEPFAAVNDPRVLLVFDGPSGELVGVAAHERAALRAPGDISVAATKLEVVAVARGWQGRSFPGPASGGAGPRVSDVVMSAAMTDIRARVPARDAHVFAVVHANNVRSRALCRRYGLVVEMSRPDPSYVRLITERRADS